MQIPVYDSQRHIIAVEEFEPNLNIKNVPNYLNEGGNMGLTRIKKGKYRGVLAILYENEIHPSSNFGELISDHDAWELCQSRGKVHLIEQLRIEWNQGII
jgi:hypothetical protein